MTAPDGSIPQSVHDAVVAQLADHRDGPFAFEPPREQRHDTVPFEERGDLILAEIRRFLNSPGSHRSLHTRLTEIGFPGRKWYAAEHDFGPEEPVAALGRRLARTASGSTPLMVGLTMLRGRAGPQDADMLRHLAFHPYEPGTAAIRILTDLPGSTEHLLQLAGVIGERGPARLAVSALCGRPEAVPWLLRHSMTGPDDWTGNALRVAQAVDLPRALREHGDDLAVVRNTAYILLSAPRVRTGATRGGLTGYADAVEAYAAFAEVCDRLPSTDHGLLERIRDDLYFHIPALIDWPPGKREEIAARLTAVLGRPAPTPRPRQAFRVGIARTGKEGETAVSLLVHGRPLLTPEFFATTRAWYLLDSDRGLHAREEPHETELANGDCVPECCGGLFVTIRREGDEVVWDGWRQTMTREPETFPELRFDVGEYEAELDRAVLVYTSRRVADLGEESYEQGLIALAGQGTDVGFAVTGLARLGTPSALDWLRRNGITAFGLVTARAAARVADATGLAAALADRPDTETVAGAARILLSTAMPSAEGALLLDRPTALADWRVLGEVAARLEPKLLALVIVELRTGQAAALPWDPGEAATLVERLARALPRGVDPGADRVLDWLERPRPVAAQGFDVLSVERPPITARYGEPGLVPLVNGVPVFPGVHTARLDADGLPRLLSTGPTCVHSGDPKEPGGATYADIERDGDIVTWHVAASRETHQTASHFRFEATAYDQAIERARTA